MRRQSSRGRSDADTRREAILDAATERMAARPITDIAVREIAARAGVAQTMIYRHIGSKQDLERAALDRTVNEVLAFTQASPEPRMGLHQTCGDSLRGVGLGTLAVGCRSGMGLLGGSPDEVAPVEAVRV